jgi:hypothetical protein
MTLIIHSPVFSCRMKFKSETWMLKHIRQTHPAYLKKQKTSLLKPYDNLQRQAGLIQQRLKSAPGSEFNTNNYHVTVQSAYPSREHLEFLMETQPEPILEARIEIFPNAGAPLVGYQPQPWECDEDGNLEENLMNDPYFPFTTREEYKFVKRGIKKKGMKTYYDNVLKEENTGLRFPSFRNGGGIQRLVASIRDGKGLGKWGFHTLPDMRWKNDHPEPITYWSRDIIQCSRLLLRQPAFVGNRTYAPERCFNANGQQLFSEMYTVDWWWETQVSF